MNVIHLSDYKGGDDRARFAAALNDAKKIPGTTVVVEPGTYLITTPRARAAQNSVMTGEYGDNPQPVMFSPDYVYDRGLDFDGHHGTTLEAYGALFIVDGFMEDISLRNCRGVTLRGLTIDNRRRPYTKGFVREMDGDTAEVELTEYMPSAAPIMRTGVYSRKYGRFVPDKRTVGNIVSNDGREARVRIKGDVTDAVGDEIYFCHTWHFRPSVLIENAKDILIENVTIHCHAGMGVTGFHSENVTLKNFSVIPAPGESHSTNTDATHFSSCRGKLVFDGCRFEGHGDDALNVHTYYYTVAEHEKNRAALEVRAPTGTHTQALDYPRAGDRMDLCGAESLDVIKTYRVTSVEVDEKRGDCTVELDGALPDDMSSYLLADPDETPEVEIRNCSLKNHFARGFLIKSRNCLIENCDFEDIFELGVKVAAESSWHEGVNVDSIVIRNCRFRNCGREKSICGGIHIYMEAPERRATHGYAEITDNLIDCPECDHGIIIKDVKRALLRNNRVISRKDPVVIGDNVKTL